MKISDTIVGAGFVNLDCDHAGRRTIPIARQSTGALELVESYRQEFPGADLSYHSASGYGGCQVLLEAIRRAGLPHGKRIREAILRLDINTIYGAFKVNKDGLQIAHKALMLSGRTARK